VVRLEQLEEQGGVATRLDGRALGQAVGESLGPQRRANEHLHLEGRKRRHVDSDVAALGPAPARLPHEELGACGGDEHQRRLPKLGAQAQDDLQALRVRQVNVVDQIHRRLQAGVLLEKTAEHRAGQVVLLLGPHGQRLHERATGRRQAYEAPEERGELGDPAITEDRLHLRPQPLDRTRLLEGGIDADARPQKLAQHAARACLFGAPHCRNPETTKTALFLHPAQPVAGQAGLAHPRGAHQRHELRCLEPGGPVERGIETTFLGLATDQVGSAKGTSSARLFGRHTTVIRRFAPKSQKPARSRPSTP